MTGGQLIFGLSGIWRGATTPCVLVFLHLLSCVHFNIQGEWIEKNSKAMMLIKLHRCTLITLYDWIINLVTLSDTKILKYIENITGNCVTLETLINDVARRTVARVNLRTARMCDIAQTLNLKKNILSQSIPRRVNIILPVQKVIKNKLL